MDYAVGYKGIIHKRGLTLSSVAVFGSQKKNKIKKNFQTKSFMSDTLSNRI